MRQSPMIEVFGSRKVLIRGVKLEDSASGSLKIYHSELVRMRLQPQAPPVLDVPPPHRFASGLSQALCCACCLSHPQSDLLAAAGRVLTPSIISNFQRCVTAGGGGQCYGG